MKGMRHVHGAWDIARKMVLGAYYTYTVLPGIIYQVYEYTTPRQYASQAGCN